MTPEISLAIVLGLVVVATALGFAWRAADGRIRVSKPVKPASSGTTRRPGTVGTAGATATTRTTVAPGDLPPASWLGDRATLLQFSSEICAACDTTRGVLVSLADTRDGVTHIELDVADNSPLISRFNIMQTPTTLILDANGAVRARIGGAVRRDTVTAELDRVTLSESPFAKEYS